MQSLDKDLIKESLTLDDIRAILRDLGSEEPIFCLLYTSDAADEL